MTNLCVVLGNGPSLKGFDFKRLQGVASIGMNAAYRYWDEIDWYPSYYACLDDQMIETHHNEIYRLWQEGRIEQFFLHNSFFTHHPECICAPGFYTLDQVAPYWFKIRGKAQGWPDLSQHPAFKSSNFDKITTGAYAARFAAYLGHDLLALMGIDLKYVEIIKEAEKTEGIGLMMRETPDENPNYFFDSYQQAGDKYNIPNPDEHDNKLHIQSFQLVPTDFAQFGQKTKVVNTNPKSLLEVEKVFPLMPIDEVLAPHKMAAIIVPSTRFEIKAILANFDIWASAQYAPLLRGDRDNRTALVFMFNNDSAKQHEAEIRARFDATQMQRFFSGIEFEYLGLEGDLDKYERDYSKEVGDHGYKSGPNNQFFRTMYATQKLGHYVFQMETDCVPLCAGWLSALREHVASEPPFWVLGSAYHGVHKLSAVFKNHINGNAIYAVGDAGFQEFVKTFWEPRTHDMVKNHDKRLAYDCIIQRVFDEEKDSDPEVAKMVEQHGDMFRYTEYMLNISGQEDLEYLAPSYETDLLLRFKTAYIMHNRTAQERIAARIPKYVAPQPVKSAHSKPDSFSMDSIILPRLLILDMTAMGNGTATGEVKSNLFRDWPADRLLQVASPTPNELSLVQAAPDGGYNETPCDVGEIPSAIRRFAPEMILYRPLPDRPALHALALSLIDDLDLPLVTWVMDDWPTRLYAEDNVAFHKFEPSFKMLLKRSVLRLSICDAMSEAFAERYRLPFQAFANGVDLAAWPEPKIHKEGPLVLRYAGGMAPDMNAKSIQRVAQAVQELADKGQDIRFEINTQAWWLEKSGKLFDGLSATTVTSHKRSFTDYAKWLIEADALLIAYNFDGASLRYVRYSMANKLPEYLGSGVPVLVHGPRDVATVDYVMKHQATQVVDVEKVAALKAALKELTDPALRQKLADTGRALAKARHDLPTLAQNLAQLFRSVCPVEVAARFGFYLAGSDGAFSTENRDLADADQALRDGANGILVYPDPLSAIAVSMEKGHDGLEALKDWQFEANAQLVLFRKMRDKLKIVEHSHAAPALVRAVAPEILRQDLRDDNPLLYALASLLFSKDPLAKRILAELRSSGASPSKEYGNIDIAAAVTHAHKDNFGATRALPVGSTQLLREQVIQLQATAETYYHGAEQMRRGGVGGNDVDNSYLQAQVGVLQLEIEDYYNSNSYRVTAPMRTFRRWVGPKGTGQERQFQISGENRYDLEQMRRGGVGGNRYLQAQVDYLQLEIEHIHNSNSYRITAPMRAFRRWVGTKGAR